MGEANFKLFFALRPPAETAEALESLAGDMRRRFKAPGPAMPKDRLHVSLNSLGAHVRRPEALVRQAVEAAATLRAPAFVLAFNRLGSWGRGDGVRPVVLWGDDGVIGAELLHVALHRVLSAVNLAPRRPQEIAPHVTLWRDARGVPETFVGPIQWRARELVLLLSAHGHGRHELLGRWRLAD